MRVVFDLYAIGGPAGFYVGQAKHMVKGGWERRVVEHVYTRYGSPGARKLLAAGATACHVARVVAERGFVNLLEARLWDVFVALGWRPVHPRPRESARYGSIEASRNGGYSLWNRMNLVERKRFAQSRRSGFDKMSSRHQREISRLGGLARTRDGARRAVIAAVASRSSIERRACMLKYQPWKRIRKESCRAGGVRAMHLRWHVQRDVQSSQCTHCAQGG